MQTLLTATYRNGSLILDQKLGTEKEGKKFDVLLFERESRKFKKKSFFKFVEEQNFILPKDHSFDREELHER